MTSEVWSKMGIDIGILIIIQFVIIIVLIALISVFIVKQVRLQRRYSKFMQGSSAESLETAIAIVCAAIPISALSSIQSAIYKRNLNFRVPFIVRIVGLGLTFFITIPLAIWLRSYWALIVSKLVHGISAAVILFVYSDW